METSKIHSLIHRCFYQHVLPEMTEFEQQQYQLYMQQQYLAQQQYYMSLQGVSPTTPQGQVYDASEIEKQLKGMKL